MNTDNKSSKHSIVEMEGLYKIIHEKYSTDRYQYGTTIVHASSKDEAMKKLNDYLDTKPDGAYTDLPCENIGDVHVFKVLD